MKQGNQFFLDFQIIDDNNNILTIEGVKKIVFYIGDLKKIYESDSDDVTYDDVNKCFKVWLTEEETMNFQAVNVDARILFNNDQILGCYDDQLYFNKTLVKESILDNQNNETNEESEGE